MPPTSVAALARRRVSRSQRPTTHRCRSTAAMMTRSQTCSNSSPHRNQTWRSLLSLHLPQPLAEQSTVPGLTPGLTRRKMRAATTRPARLCLTPQCSSSMRPPMLRLGLAPPWPCTKTNQLHNLCRHHPELNAQSQLRTHRSTKIQLLLIRRHAPAYLLHLAPAYYLH